MVPATALADAPEQCTLASVGGPVNTDLNALEGTDNQYNAPVDATNIPGSVPVQGFPTWYMILMNYSKASVPNPTITISSGLAPSVFDGELPTPSFPSSCTLPNHMSLPANSAMGLTGGNLRAPGIQERFSPGFDSTRSVSPATVPVGGGKVTVTVAVTVTNPQFAGGPLTVDLPDIYYPGVTLVSLSPPENRPNLYECPTLPCNYPPGVAPTTWTLESAQVGKQYVFSAVVMVANPPPSAPSQTAQPWAWLPSTIVTAASNVTNAPGCTGACGGKGSSVTIPVPDLDGSTPGSGAIAFSVGTSSDNWTVGVQPANSVYYPETPYPPPLPTGVSPTTIGTRASATTSLDNPTNVAVSANGASIRVSVPANALPAGTTVSLYSLANSSALAASLPAGNSYVASSGVSWITNDGTSPTASSPITMTISDPNIVAGDEVFEVTPAGGLSRTGSATAQGAAVLSFTSDPTFIVAAVVAAPPTTTTTSTTQVPTTTTSSTTTAAPGVTTTLGGPNRHVALGRLGRPGSGFPWPWLILPVVLLSGGGVLLWIRQRRRAST